MVKSTSPAEAIAGLIKGGTAKWAKQRKAEERDKSAVYRRRDVMIRTRRITIIDAAYDVMEAAYMKASNDDTLPANARQIYYAARPEILRRTGRDTLDSKYFCQTLLTQFMDEFEVRWNVVWDDRGHIVEPHTSKIYGLGTLNVRAYLSRFQRPIIYQPGFAGATVSTCGPDGRFGAVLFIEKEGFMPLFEQVKLAEKYDIAIMSTKGMSVTAARELADRMCGPRDIPLLVLHDFDDSGFSIGNTIGTSSFRYHFCHKIKIIDIGLRLADIEGLEREDYQCRSSESTLRDNGATDEEIAILSGGERVELNAMSSDVFIEFVEGKLDEHGIKKVVPAKETLDAAYLAYARNGIVREAVRKAIEGINGASAPWHSRMPPRATASAPADLEQQVREYLDENPEDPWETAVDHVAARSDGGAP